VIRGDPTTIESYWSRDSEGLLRDLGAASSGLSPAEAASRLRRYGPNTLRPTRAAGPWALFFRQFRSPIVLILLFAVGISFVVRDWSDAGIILAIILGSAALSFRQEWSAGRAVDRLQEKLSPRATVVRLDATLVVPAAEVVPGDIVLLAAGSLVPADAVVLEARDFFVNQAILTGESYPVERSPGPVAPDAPLGARKNVVFQGTNVRSGTARAVAVRTGTATEFGAIAGRLKLRPPTTAFEQGIRRLGYLLSEITLLLVLAVFAINVAFHRPVLESLLFSLALAVGLTPQLLPAIVNITLARGSAEMARRGVIVRRLESIEEFGSMDVLCTDKTGTLTVGVVTLDRAVDSSGRDSPEALRLAYWNAKLQTGLPNPMDEAILASPLPGYEDSRKIDEIPYDFHRKRLSVVVEEKGGERTLITKGAVPGVLEVCSAVATDRGEAILDGSGRAAIDALFTGWSGEGYRVLAVATRRVAPAPAYDRGSETALTLRGFLLFFDPPKPGVRETVSDLASLGVELKIITGDHSLVARHTANAIGLPVTGELTGSEVDRLGAEALCHAAERSTLFAEIEPNQKERIILALRKLGRVVGYMGDGINDAPALHAANLGISVDGAVDVAKEAADFVLLRKDLSVLHGGIVGGRITFGNTLKYIFMATSANFGNMFSMAGASLFLPFLPMLPKQILLVNFLTDLPEMTIAGDRVDPEFLARPRRWDVAFLRRFMIVFGALSSVFDYLTFAILLWVLRAGPAEFHTGWFVESVVSATAIIFVVRSRLPLTKGRPSLAMVATAAVVMAVAMALPYAPAAAVLGFAPLPPGLLLAVVGIVLAYFIAAEVAKRQFYARGREAAGPYKDAARARA
jgi:Mg2+-importing ATPase